MRMPFAAQLRLVYNFKVHTHRRISACNVATLAANHKQAVEAKTAINNLTLVPNNGACVCITVCKKLKVNII